MLPLRLALIHLIGSLLLAGCAQVVEYKAPPLPPPQEAPALYQPPLVQDYRLRAGDALSIRSYFDAQLNQEALVRPDGRISVLLLGDVDASGLTPAELAGVIRGHYKRLVGATDLTVALTRSAGMGVYLSGEVRTPSVVALDGSLTLLQALARVGGALDSANTTNVLLIRNRDDGTLAVSKVDLERIYHSEAADPYLQPRDVIHVPKSPVSQAGLFVEQYVNAIVPRAIQLQLGWVSSRVTNKNPVLQVGTP